MPLSTNISMPSIPAKGTATANIMLGISSIYFLPRPTALISSWTDIRLMKADAILSIGGNTPFSANTAIKKTTIITPEIITTIITVEMPWHRPIRYSVSL